MRCTENAAEAMNGPPTVVKGIDVLRDYLLQEKKRGFRKFARGRMTR